jgi:hypothetical protein
MANVSTHTIFGALRDKWQRTLRNHRARVELAACPPGELHRIAQEVGLSEQALRSLDCSHPGPAELMPERLRQLGLDPTFIAQAQAPTYRDLERVCASCKSWRRCARDLANGDVQSGMGGYCLNASTLDALLVEPALSRSAHAHR